MTSETGLLAPLASHPPCGPDLEASDDLEFMSCVAGVQGLLPSSYFEYLYPEREEDRVKIDIPAAVGRLAKLCARTHDLRLWSLRARLHILGRDLQGFEASLLTIADLASDYWDTFHPMPEPEDGSVDRRRIEFDALDAPTVIFPLQYTPLIENRRIGPISWRSWLLAQKSVKARPGENVVSTTTLLDALRDADADDIRRTRGLIAGVIKAVSGIQTAWMEKTREETPPLGKLLDLARSIAGLIDSATAGAAPAAEPASPVRNGATPGKAAAAPGPSGPTAIADAAGAHAALAELARYYRDAEPSNPALPLIEEAIKLRGCSFFEALQLLIPKYADDASFQIGAQWVFDLSLQRIANRSERVPAAPAEPASAPAWTVDSRGKALSTMASVSAFYRDNEPSSPIPWLLDRAMVLADRDFLSLLRDVLPRSALRDIADR